MSEYIYDTNKYDSYKTYIESIQDIPRISKEEEVELSKVILDNEDKKLVKDAINKLIISNLFLVVKYATDYHKKFSSQSFDYGLSLMDLIGEGNSGLVRASKTFNYSKGAFSTYATYYIKKQMNKASGNSRFIRIPLNHYNIISKIKKLKSDGFEITNKIKEEVAEICDVTVKQVDFIMQCNDIKVCGFASFGGVENEDNETLNFLDFYIDEKGKGKTEVEKREEKTYLLSKIYTLSKMEQEVIYMRFFGVEASYEEMGEVLGISKQRICQIITGALKKLKYRIESDNRKENI